MIRQYERSLIAQYSQHRVLIVDRKEMTITTGSA
jgi:hypothetical protein